MKQATINTLKSVGGKALSVLRWALMRRKLLVALASILFAGSAVATGNVSAVIDIVAQLVLENG